MTAKGASDKKNQRRSTADTRESTDGSIAALSRPASRPPATPEYLLACYRLGRPMNRLQWYLVQACLQPSDHPVQCARNALLEISRSVRAVVSPDEAAVTENRICDLSPLLEGVCARDYAEWIMTRFAELDDELHNGSISQGERRDANRTLILDVDETVRKALLDLLCQEGTKFFGLGEAIDHGACNPLIHRYFYDRARPFIGVIVKSCG